VLQAKKEGVGEKSMGYGGKKKHTRVGAFLGGMSERLAQPTEAIMRMRHVVRLEKGKEGGR
jgi:hypothetical protein